MFRHVHGHQVHIEACDGLRGHYRVHTTGARPVFLGLVSSDTAGWHTFPARRAGGPLGPVCHAPTFLLAVGTLLAETIDHQESDDGA